MLEEFKQKIIGPAMILIGGFVAYRGFESGKLDGRLQQEGTITKGLILQHETTRGRRGGTTYNLLTRYSAGPQTLTQRFSVSNRFYSEHPDGEEIDVRYIRLNPELAQIDGERGNSTLELIVGSVLCVAGVIVSLLLLRR